MKIAIAGKGGSGKTTIAATLARGLARLGRTVVAVDADTNPNLAALIGLSPGARTAAAALPAHLLEKRVEADGAARLVFTADADQVLREFALPGPDGVRVVLAGRVDHSGAG